MTTSGCDQQLSAEYCILILLIIIILGFIDKVSAEAGGAEFEVI